MNIFIKEESTAYKSERIPVIMEELQKIRESLLTLEKLGSDSKLAFGIGDIFQFSYGSFDDISGWSSSDANR